MKPSTSVLALERVIPGAGRGLRLPGHCMGLSALRDLLRRLTERAQVASLGDLEPTHTRERPRVALAFLGGHASHARYVAPLLDALGLEAHFFVPCETIGKCGHLSLKEIATLRHCRRVHVDVDLSALVSRSSWRTADRLRDSAAILEAHTGRACRYVWVGRGQWDRRLPMLLRHARYIGVVSCGFPRNARFDGLRLLAATRPSRRLLLGLPGV
jgi:peptidoglycan/xylan/chitin deacetylase (PgdA/CDA1 family)